MDKSAKVLQPFVSRQSIYTRSVQLFAYELLYQRNVVEQALLADSGNGTREPFLKTFSDGLEELAGENLAFINIPRMFILQDYCGVFPKERAILQISRDVEVDENIFRSLRTLSESGYKLALDDFDCTEQNRPVLELANYLNLNFQRLTRDEMTNQLSTLSRSKAKAIASRVDTHEEFEMAKTMGFEYFRGSCFHKPKIPTPARIPINRLSTMQLVLKLQDPELSMVELEKIVSQDLAISYKLLRFVNSAALSLTRNIESIKHAIQMVGTARIRSWASLLLLTKLDDKPAELLVTALVRARMCEGLALAMGYQNPDSYHMVGLFSVVDALLNVTMPDAIQLLPFSRQVREALVNHGGQMGSVLSCVLDYESGDWDDVRCGDLDAATIRQCYMDAISAAQKMPKGTDQDR
jgi:EAL and modified HD-GYP domain-containing signal transduction protein